MKDRTVCKSCYNKNRRKNINTIIENEICTSHQQPKFNKINKNNVNNPNVLAYENHCHVVIGPSNVGKTSYMLKILEKICNKKTHSYNYPITQSKSNL